MNKSQTLAIQAIAEQAANWYLSFEEEGELSLTDREAFVQWLGASPTNIEEFMRVSATHAQFAGEEIANLDYIEELLQQAKSNVVALGGKQRHLPSTSARPRKRTIWAVAASIVAIALFVNLFDQLSPISRGYDSIYETALGEQRSVVLSDGSVVELNTESKLRVLFTDNSRLVELVAGEAVFDVAKDPQRKFRVDAGAAIVEALGTRFNVYRQKTQTIVTVVEGRVEVSQSETTQIAPAAEDPGVSRIMPPIELAPGNQIAISTTGVASEPSVIDSTKAVAWTQRRLVFDSDSLAVVAREINRYNRRQLLISDSTLSAQSISGVFYANDPETLITFLETIGGVSIESDSEGWTAHAK